MLTKDRFNGIKKGDVLLFNSGASREVVDKTLHKKDRVGSRRRHDTVFLTFNKINGVGVTVYLYGDIHKKVVGIFKVKK